MGRGGDPSPPPHLSNSGWPFRGRAYFVIVFLVGQGWTPVQKKLTELEIYLFLLYSCSKILVYMMLSNRIINTQIWCLLLDQVCPNEHHLPVPFPHIHCDRGGVGRGGGHLLLLIAHLTNSEWPLGVGWVGVGIHLLLLIFLTLDDHLGVGYILLLYSWLARVGLQFKKANRTWNLPVLIIFL